jgi:hypothetical protein
MWLNKHTEKIASYKSHIFRRYQTISNITKKTSLFFYGKYNSNSGFKLFHSVSGICTRWELKEGKSIFPRSILYNPEMSFFDKSEVIAVMIDLLLNNEYILAVQPNI